MTARDTILNAVLAACPAGDARAVADAAAALLDDPDSSRPPLAAPGLPEAFTLKATALGASVERVANMASVPEAVARYLERHGLAGLSVQPAPALTALDWTGIATHDHLAADEPAALGLALYGIAESGSLVVHSGPDAPILLSFLPLHHIVVLRESTLLPWLEDYAARLEAASVPRNAILITGPSGTTDIEGSYVRGAHGPGFLHIIITGTDDIPE